MRRGEIKGCAACRGTDHTVRSCEDPRAVAWFREQARLDPSPTHAARRLALADALERRLAGVSRVGTGRPRLAR